MSSMQFEDLPDEDILKIFSFLDIKDILKCGQVSKRLWLISKDESLWLKLNLFQRTVPSEFIQKASENGCKYLNVFVAFLLLFKAAFFRSCFCLV